jgi:hypothetical protein
MPPTKPGIYTFCQVTVIPSWHQISPLHQHYEWQYRYIYAGCKIDFKLVLLMVANNSLQIPSLVIVAITSSCYSLELTSDVNLFKLRLRKLWCYSLVIEKKIYKRDTAQIYCIYIYIQTFEISRCTTGWIRGRGNCASIVQVLVLVQVQVEVCTRPDAFWQIGEYRYS